MTGVSLLTMLQRAAARCRRAGSLVAHRAKSTVLRLAPRLIALIPGWLRPPLVRVYEPLARRLAAAPYRRKYGGRFLSTIHPDDDLLHYAYPFADEYSAFRYYRAAQMYFSGGDWNTNDVERVLESAGFPLRSVRSMLEFACGYGRLTRHFVQRLAPSQITVCDIAPGGVDFLTDRLGVRGFYSTPTAQELRQDRRYELIVVVSLFSHLPHEAWGPWLARLCSLLEPGGMLLITASNLHDANPQDFERQAEDFLYRRQNETRGRLDPRTYGAAFVSEAYVRRAVAEHFDGRLVSFVPRGLLIAQDAYVLQRSIGEREPRQPTPTELPAVTTLARPVTAATTREDEASTR